MLLTSDGVLPVRCLEGDEATERELHIEDCEDYDLLDAVRSVGSPQPPYHPS